MKRRRIYVSLMAVAVVASTLFLGGCGPTRSYWGVDSGWDGPPEAYWGVEGGTYHKKHKKHKKPHKPKHRKHHHHDD